MRQEAFDAAKYIMDHANPTEGSGTFGTLLHLAIAKLQPDHVRLLIASLGANCTEPLNGETPAHQLVKSWHLDQKRAELCLNELIKGGANLN